MPLLTIHANVERPRQVTEVLGAFSRSVSEMLEKPERYVMVRLECSADMLFDAQDRATAYLELKSIDLPEDRTARFSQSLCQLTEQHLGIPSDRVYIEFSNISRHLWGWNGATF